MTVRRLGLVIGGVLVLVGVIFGLLVPVSISDGNGNAIGCGSAWAPNTQNARNATQQTNNQSGANLPVIGSFAPHSPDYVAQCQSSLGGQRTWTIVLTLIGAAAIAGALLVNRRRAPGAGI